MPQLTWLRLGITLAILLSAFGAGYEFRVLIDHSNERAQLKAQAEAQAAAQSKADQAAKGWEDQLVKLRSANTKLTRRLNNEVTKSAYTDCAVPVGGVQLYNDAVGQAARGIDGSVPTP